MKTAEELDRLKRHLQRKRQAAINRRQSTGLFDKLISATQKRLNELRDESQAA
tara:strand:+ start:1779 stop:1937 length:159 start_codon:yes stop_codon:yes gene_type:complete